MASIFLGSLIHVRLFKGYLKQPKIRVSARVSRPRSSAKKVHPNWSRLENSALDILGLFGPRTFLGFDFCPHSIISVTTITILLDICLSFARLWLLLYRRGLRINTDRFPKRAPKAQASRGVREQAPTGKKIGFLLLKVSFPGFPSHSDRMLARW